MGDNDQPEVKVGYLQLSEQERKLADAVLSETKSFLVGGFRDELAKARAEWEKETVPSTRPGFPAPPSGDTVEIDIKRYGALRRPIVHKATGQTIGYADPGTLLTKRMPDDHALGAPEGGLLPPMQLSPDERERAAKEFAGIVKSDEKTFGILRFPRGDIENFSVARWAMALERSQNTAEGTSAFQKWAP